MKKHLRNAPLPFILMAVASFFILVIVDAIGDDNLPSAVASILMVFVSFVVSALAIWMVARDGLMRNDRFLMVNTHLAVSLLIFAISEVAGIVLNQLGELSQVILLAGVVQLVAVGLVAEGMMEYLLSTNQVLEFAKSRYAIPLLVLVVTSFFVVVQGGFLIISSQVYPLGLVLSIPLEIGLTIVAISMIILLRYYRGGFLVIPMLLTILGTLLLLARTLLWGFQLMELLNPTSQIIAGAGYLLLGAALSFKSEEMAKVD
ncbi:MAG: hypothetical protein P1Q69_17685 [Candidatus Thorarchaeota archaeon]|nr:hypothetical protein [Candidatus Thorarchaeota archaeon]